MPISLKAKLRSLREQKGYSLDKLAEKTGMSKSYLWELENRERGNPSAEKLARLADVLGVTTEYLLNDDAQPDNQVVREAFFRKYDRLDAPTKRKLEDIIDRWSRDDEKST